MPTVNSISPTSGISSAPVLISGLGFTGATAVMFGTNAATSFFVENDGQIIATAPQGTGIVDITVTTSAGTSATSSADQFTYSGVTVANIVTDIEALTTLTPTYTQIVPFINELLKNLGWQCFNIKTVVVYADGHNWAPLPNDSIRIESVLDCHKRPVRRYRTSNTLFSAPSGMYIINYYARPLPVALATDILPCSDSLTPAFAPWCIFRLLQDPTDADALAWADQAKGFIADAVTQLQPRRQDSCVYRR